MRMSSSLSPLTALSSNRLPATVATRLGSDGPRFASGQDRVTVARVMRSPSTLPADGSERRGTASSRMSRATTRAAERSLSSGVSPGTATKVPLDCSPAMISAARRGSIGVSSR